jgi:hypothetical protein
MSAPNPSWNTQNTWIGIAVALILLWLYVDYKMNSLPGLMRATIQEKPVMIKAVPRGGEKGTFDLEIVGGLIRTVVKRDTTPAGVKLVTGTGQVLGLGGAVFTGENLSIIHLSFSGAYLLVDQNKNVWPVASLR